MEATRNAHEAQELAQSRAVAPGLLNEREQELRLELSKSAVTASSLQIDLDLAEIKTDLRSALLRLARRYQALSNIQMPRLDEPAYEDQLSRVSELRTFIGAAIIAVGQDFAPLMPPVTDDSRERFGANLDSDGHALLGDSEGEMVQLWDLRTGARTVLSHQAAGESSSSASAQTPRRYSPTTPTVSFASGRRVTADFSRSPTPRVALRLSKESFFLGDHAGRGPC